MKPDTNHLLTIDSKSLGARLLLAAFLALAVLFVWFSVSWQIGNMFAGFTKPTEANAEAVADMAVSMAPGDPLAVWLKAVIAQDASASDYVGFEDVIRLSPNDYRWWVQMGRAFEQADKAEKAELAFNRAIEIAPNYVLPRWQAGNYYLRQGNETAALKNLKRAAELDEVYREQVFSVVWDFFEEDEEKLESLAKEQKGVYSGLAKFYAGKGKPEKSLESWNKLSKSERTQNADVAKLVAQALFDKGFFATSVRFRDELGIEKGAGVGKMHNGGFEAQIPKPDGVLFSWKIVKVEGMRVQTNGFKKRSGNRSLEVSFGSFSKPDINNVYQTIAVKGGARYRLSFWVKTEKLAGAALPQIQVINTVDSKPLGSSKAYER
ncbi:MAG: hypothetical protein HKN33_10305, partial [Pyrinomonadaceae bacterium]|nr:hypothetical protein [Pyrinomonadaceae bacterium]